MKTILKILLVISAAVSIIIFAVWFGLEFHDYSETAVYSENNFICAMQYVKTGLWGVSMAISPVWCLGAIVMTVKLLFPTVKLLNHDRPS